MAIFSVEIYVNNDENFALVKATDLPTDHFDVDASPGSDFLDFTPIGGPENRPASPVEWFGTPLTMNDEQFFAAASHEHGSDLQAMEAPNNGANFGLGLEIAQSSQTAPAHPPAPSPKRKSPQSQHIDSGHAFMPSVGQEIAPQRPNGITAQLGAGFTAAAEMQDLLQRDPAQQWTAAPSTSFTAISGQEIEHAGPAGFFVQQQPTEPAAVPFAGSPVPQPAPVVANTGFMPIPGQEIYGVHNLAPHQIPQEDGRYVVKVKRGRQKRSASKRARDDQEPTPKPPAKNPKRRGAHVGWSPRLRIHHQRCLNPAAGCDESCEIREKHFDKYERMRKKPNKDCKHLPLQYQTELWKHVPQ